MDFSKVTYYLDSLADIGIAGTDLAIYHRGEPVYRHHTGFADIETRRPITADTLYAIYSMTKIVTCVTALRLYERGAFLLNDRLADYLPEFAKMMIKSTGEDGATIEEEAKNPIRIVDLFTMSSGHSYDFSSHVDALGKKTKGNYTLREMVTELAKEPLLFEPGTHWSYGVSHDILGVLVEEISGKSLGELFHEQIFAPLGMEDTFFKIPKDKQARLAKCYTFDEKTRTHRLAESLIAYFDYASEYYLSEDFVHENAGGGLVSSVDDYAIFANALCNGGTATNGYKLLGKSTVDLMRTNHLDDVRVKDYSWDAHSGYGYGLGVRTMIDRAFGGSNSAIGEFGWSGMLGTYVLCDPTHELTYVYAQQLLPSKEEIVAPRLRNIIYGCL
ncbi:MAG: beta-lactamase family protein [Lachnospiraceae bacterium]|nr:beta-lactamase family protein [Lachnospiraceae bacterium]